MTTIDFLIEECHEFVVLTLWYLTDDIIDGALVDICTKIIAKLKMIHSMSVILHQSSLVKYASMHAGTVHNRSDIACARNSLSAVVNLLPSFVFHSAVMYIMFDAIFVKIISA